MYLLWTFNINNNICLVFFCRSGEGLVRYSFDLEVDYITERLIGRNMYYISFAIFLFLMKLCAGHPKDEN